MTDTPWPIKRGVRVAVAGGGGGIGSATALAFHRQGAKVVLLDLSFPHDMPAEIEKLHCDLTSAESVEQGASEAGPCDILVNAAGINIRGALIERSRAEVERVFAVNLTGAVHLATQFARAMMRRGGGTIINIASQHAFTSGRLRGAYSASKAALVQFTRTAAIEWAPGGVRVVGCAPGPVRTALIDDLLGDPEARRKLLEGMPFGQLIEPEQIAGIILFLASPAASAIVGTTVVADGGWLVAQK